MPTWVSSMATAILAVLSLVDSTSAFQQRLAASPGSRGRGSRCPATCSVSGPNPAGWDVYGALDHMDRCDRTVFYHVSLFDDMDDATKRHQIYACTSDSDRGGSLADATRALLALLADGYRSTTTGAQVLFAQNENTTAGLYVGSAVEGYGAVSEALASHASELAAAVQASGFGAVELCSAGHDADHVFGFAASQGPAFTPVQAALQAWSRGQCQPVSAAAQAYTGPVAFSTPRATADADTRSFHNYSRRHSAHEMGLARRDDDCTTVQVVAGDTCATLAAKCGVSADDLAAHNPSSDLCATMTPGQHVCCTEGDLPSLVPEKQPDGSCYAYHVVADDTCDTIGANFGLDSDDIDRVNKNTWGWQTCANLPVGAVICLSEGDPPMPAPMANAVCGPQKNGTVPGDASDAGDAGNPGTRDLAGLNPCPLNACCNTWGQCGITADFCTDTNTGPPGTAADGTPGCISHCGTDPVIGDMPKTTISIAYYEGYGMDRDCLFQDIYQIPADTYTHIHFAFATMDASYTTVTLGSDYAKFQFKRMQTAAIKERFHRVITFGGWAFSTDPSTYSIFRDGVTDANREAMATAMADFVTSNDLDGIDIDWEYPGAPDLPGIEPGGQDDGQNYLAFLKLLKGKLGDKTVSISAPASYWYLQHFPIREMAQVVDYIVYMTYDLHGQWDAGSKGAAAAAGCDAGHCLRSHVNLTETMASLAMITKAGVNTNKIVVGVTSYGRAFRMADATCWGPECTYVYDGNGNSSTSAATPGQCTNTAGILANAEIRSVMDGVDLGSDVRRRMTPEQIFVQRDTSSANVSRTYYDEASDSQIAVYNGNQWVSYMTPEILALRIAKYTSLHFAGTSNWATDLATNNDAPGTYTSWAQYKAAITAGTADAGSPRYSVPRTGTWMEVGCTDDITDISRHSSAERWRLMDAESAWKDLIAQYHDDAQEGTLFSTSMANNGQWRPGLRCQDIDASNCDTSMDCKTSDKVGAASYEIFNSLVVIHNIYMRYHNALVAETALVFDSQLDFLVKTFAPVEAKTKLNLTFLMVLVSFVGTMAASYLFNSVLRNVLTAKMSASFYDNNKDLSKALVAFSASTASAYATIAKTKWNADSQVAYAALVGHANGAWDDINTNTLARLFDGSPESIALLWSLISDGKLIGGLNLDGSYSTPNPLSDEAGLNGARAFVSANMYGTTIPNLWRTAKNYAFVATLDRACDDDAKIPDLSDDDRKLSTACIDDRLYALVYPKGKWKTLSCGKAAVTRDCSFPPWRSLPGVESLDGSQWGNVTVERLIRGALATYKANGNANSPEPFNVEDQGVIEAAMEGAVSDENPGYAVTPGMVTLPVCAADHAYGMWKDHWGMRTDNDDWPCTPRPVKTKCGATSFVNDGSAASPRNEDCLKIADKLEEKPDHVYAINTLGKTLHKVASSGSCQFSTKPRNVRGIIKYHIANNEIVNWIRTAVDKFGDTGKIGAHGDVSCDSDYAGDQDIQWLIYNTDRN